MPPFGVSAYSGRKWPFVLSVGRLWDEAKNLTALESIASQLNWPVYVAGEETDPETGKKTPLLDASVRRLGKLTPDHVMAFMRRAGIYALPARYEPFGLSVLEAALCGCALVLSDIPSLRENWDGAAVWVAPIFRNKPVQGQPGRHASLMAECPSIIPMPCITICLLFPPACMAARAEPHECSIDLS